MRTRALTAAVAFAVGALTSSIATAQWAPASPVMLVVPFAAGGPTDAMGRQLAEHFRTHLGANVLVENRPGAGGNLGAAEVARAAPDGLKILFATTGQLAINKSLFRTLDYDPVESFDPIILIGDLPNVLVVRGDLPATNLEEFLAFARSQDEPLTYASSGYGATSHLAGVLFEERTGIALEHVPYQGTGPALTDLAGGHVDITFTDVLTAKPMIEAGLIKPIGITTPDSSAALPDVASLTAQGLDDYDISVSFGLLVPKNTPPEIVATWNEVARRSLNDPALHEWLEQQGIRLAADESPEGLSRYIAEAIPRWKQLVDASGSVIE